MSKTKFCQGISDLSDSYTGFILDQWGVLHDGKTVFPEVIEVMRELKARKKEVIILTNSGKRSDANAERLADMGLPRDMYDHMVSAGEMTWQGLHDRKEGIFQGLGNRVYLISRGGDRSIVDGLDLKVVDEIETADFLLISGSDAPNKELDDYDPILKKASQKRMKAICANPDVYALIDGKTYFGAGQIAKRFISYGGVCDFIGKPYQPIIRYCMSLFQNALPASTIIVGDSMAHDIMGGALLNIDTALVMDGVHGKHFENATDNVAEKDKILNALINNYGCKPNYMVDKFQWGKALPDRKHKKTRSRG